MHPRELASWPNHELSRLIEAGGVRWHVQQAGVGPDLLLLHGTGASTHSWRDLIHSLARHFTVLAPDLPGHGFSSAPPGPSSIGGMSTSLAALLDRLGMKPQHCVGHSAGAVVLTRLSLDGFLKSAHIVAINGAFLPLGGVAGLLFAPLAQLLVRTPRLPRWIARRASRPASVRRVIEGTGSRLSPEGLALYGRLLSDEDHIAGTLRMLRDWDLHGFANDLSQLTARLTLLVGEADRAVPPRQARLVQGKVPSTAIQWLPGLGHLAHEEAPAVLVQSILHACELRSESTQT